MAYASTFLSTHDLLSTLYVLKLMAIFFAVFSRHLTLWEGEVTLIRQRTQNQVSCVLQWSI